MGHPVASRSSNNAETDIASLGQGFKLAGKGMQALDPAPPKLNHKRVLYYKLFQESACGRCEAQG